MTYIGIDISKNSFTAAIPNGKGYRVQEFSNDSKGIHKFIGMLDSKEHHCVMEATGNYGFLLLYFLEKNEIRCSMVNPLKIKNYARMMMSVTKTDMQDARLIADYGRRMQPELYKMPSEDLLLLKQRRTVIRQLKKQLTASKNMRSSLECLPVKDKSCMESISKTIAFLEKQLKHLESDLVEKASSVFERQLKALTSIKGIGITLATALIISTGGFSCFSNAKQLSRYIGICPTVVQSGSSINVKGRVNKNGDENLRSLLYIASWTAIRYNTSCKECYQRLRSKGKPGKVALVAVSNKLVRQAFAVVKSNKEYIDGFVSTQPGKNISPE